MVWREGDSGGGGDRHCNATGAGSGTSHRQVEGGGGGQPTVPANQGDQRGAGHSMMQGGGGGSNLSCQLPAAGATATT